jgi:hypothetical protein
MREHERNRAGGCSHWPVPHAVVRVAVLEDINAAYGGE